MNVTLVLIIITVHSPHLHISFIKHMLIEYVLYAATISWYHRQRTSPLKMQIICYKWDLARECAVWSTTVSVRAILPPLLEKQSEVLPNDDPSDI